jgi:adhesin HecA-like repeat protein
MLVVAASLVRPAHLKSLAALAIVASGCATTSLTASPAQLANRAGDIVANGRTTVPHLDGGDAVTVAGGDIASVRVIDRDGVERPLRLTVHELVEGCVDDVESPDCLASHTVAGKPAIERRKTRVDKTQVAAAATLVVAGSMLGYCVVECEQEPDIGKGIAITTGAVVGLSALFVLAMAAH